jgi:hypothetical protein
MKIDINDSGKPSAVDSATVIYDVMVGETEGQLYVKLTSEGIILDFWANDDKLNVAADGALKTACYYLDDVCDLLN